MLGRALGIDYGKKRIGLAVSDPLGTIAQGLPTITNDNLANVITTLERIILEHDIQEIVVGYPLTMKAKVGRAADSTDHFIAVLKGKFALPTIRWDERLTSVLAERTIKELGQSPSKNKHKVDELAAVFILQSYLDSKTHRSKIM